MELRTTVDWGRQLLSNRSFTVFAAVVGLLLAVDLTQRLSSGNLAAAQLLSYLWDGLVFGLGLGLAGIGLSMTYSILNFANFGHGDYLTAGAFSGWSAAWLLAGMGSGAGAIQLLLLESGLATQVNVSIIAAPLEILGGLVVAAVVTVLLSLLLDRIVYKPMRDEEGISLLIASIGVALALRYTIVLFFNTDSRGLTAGDATVDLPVGAGAVTVTAHQTTLVIVAVALMLGVHLLLQRSKLGKAMRAMADNEDLARVTGIPTERVVRFTWIIGGGLAGAAGFLLALERGNIVFSFGWRLLLPVFAAVILGGIGSIYGAMFGGIAIGIARSVSAVWIPAEFSLVAAFLLMILVLLFKPSGIFQGRTTA
ncbi:ABC-type transporter, integral membrane subunit [halophilic archaeon DL31]|jgi:branched-chain amino acid transport system permease protein|nr:ABC-type transporter, integral membrane subunit [halophilic archaeon DL31]